MVFVALAALGVSWPLLHQLFVARVGQSLHGQAVDIAELAWGLWLFPLALLVLRSGFLTRLFGYGLILNGLAYVMQSLAWALLPAWQDTLSSLLGPLQFVEVLFMLWLLVRGARPGFRRTVPATTTQS